MFGSLLLKISGLRFRLWGAFVFDAGRAGGATLLDGRVVGVVVVVL